MTFSQSEKEDALLEFARSDPLSGGSVARSLELIRATLIQEPDAIFTVLRLTTAKLLTTVGVMLELLDELTDAATDLAAKPQELTDISSLQTSAKLARSVGASVTDRGAVGRAQGVRLSTSLKKSAEDLTEGLRSSSRLSASYDEARGTASRNLRTLKSQLEVVEITLSNLSGAVTALNNSNIRSRLAEDRVTRIRLGVEDLADQMEGLEPVDRSTLAKQSALRLLAADVELQDVLRDLTSGQPRLFQPKTTPATYKLDAAGEGTAPEIVGDISSPWSLVDGALAFNVNGVATGTIDVLDGGSGVEAAALTGTVHEDDNVPGFTGFPISPDISTPLPIESSVGPFIVTGGVDDQLYIKVDSETFRIPLPPGSVSSATAIILINSNTAVIAAGNPVTAFDVGGRVRLTYTALPKPVSYSARHLEVITAQGGYSPQADATQFSNWRLYVSPFTLGTRSTGWQGNNILKFQVNDDPSTISVTLPTGPWPHFLTQLGDDVTAGTIVYAIDQAAGAEGENFSAEDVSGYLRVFSLETGEGSIVTVRTDGTDSVAGRAARLLGFGRNQEDRKEDISGLSVLAPLKRNASLSAGADVFIDRTDYFEGSGEITSGDAVVDNKIEFSVSEDPTADWPDASVLKLTVNAHDANGTYDVASYSWSAGMLTVSTARRLRDPSSTVCWAAIYTAFLHIESKDATTTGQLQATGAARAPLGLPSTLVRSTVRQLLVSENDPIVGWVTMNLVGNNIRELDPIHRPDGSVVDVITDIDEENGLLGLSTGVLADFSLSTDGFTIFSAAALAYATLVNEVEDWTYTAPPDLLAEAADAFARLYVAKSRDAASNARSTVTVFKTSIQNLQTSLAAYEPPELSNAINALNALSENGQDRARALLVDADVSGFVGVSGDGSTIEALRMAASAVSYKDLGAQRDNRQSIPRAVWVDATDPRNTYPDFEPEEEIHHKPPDWGDAEI